MGPAGLGTVSVITITRRRPEQLLRAISSVARQTFERLAEHLVLVDDCDVTESVLAFERPRLPQTVHWTQMRRSSSEFSGPGRSARLRNEGARRATGRWVAYIDDDNEWEPGHVASLVALAERTGCRAVHSYRKVLNADGTPFTEERYPWARSEEESARVYERLCELGIVVRGSCVRRDRVDPELPLVDSGEWLLERELLLEVPFGEEFSAEDEQNVVGEDDKLLAELIARSEPTASTRLPTLRYRLGGYSNTFVLFDSSFRWR